MDSTPAAWSNADAYLAELLVGHDPHLESALSAQRDAGLPEICLLYTSDAADE